MTTVKQIEANQKNAQLSTGAVTEGGKAIVSKNAVKHGIFAKEVLISTGDGKEDVAEFGQVLQGLIKSLNPSNQIEHLLVEKIAVDFWRLRRVFKFETGCIRRQVNEAISDYYNQTNLYSLKEAVKTCTELDQEISEKQDSIDSNCGYIECLKRGIVSFDQATWSGEGVESDIELDLSMILEEDEEEILTPADSKRYAAGEMEFEEVRAAFKKAGYENKDIAEKLIDVLERLNQAYMRKITEWKQQRERNRRAEEVSIQRNSLPSGDDAEKVMKYEKSIQKSILHNLALLKKLQGIL